ncbi:MAG: hypothetical protein K9J74_08120 [Sulfuritalea sp.]|nr:hypothetical protein [Sulfuritalea sp.]
MESIPSTTQEKPSPGNARDRSTVDFVYTDLDSAIEIAQSIHAVGGTTCDYDQLAAHMGFEAKGGGFRNRVLGARGFGLISYERGGKITLTEIGRKVIDPHFEKSAKVDAFLSVELFSKVFEQFKGSPLPPQAGLERALVALGVSDKVKDKARQVLQRSAKQAGFFELSPDRLTKPSIKNEHDQHKGVHESRTESERHGKDEAKSLGGGHGGGPLHPAFQLLLQTLPEPGEEWDVQQRVNWLTLANSAFNMIYKAKDGDQQVEIKMKE